MDARRSSVNLRRWVPGDDDPEAVINIQPRPTFVNEPQIPGGRQLCPSFMYVPAKRLGWGSFNSLELLDVCLAFHGNLQILKVNFPIPIQIHRPQGAI